MVYPNIIGMELDEALKELYLQNCHNFQLQLTSPGPGNLPEGKVRVIRVCQGDDTKLGITVAFENYLRGGV